MSPDSKPIRVLFVEDHQLLADALSAMLAREPDIDVVGVAGTVADAKAMARERLDVVLMDYRLPDGTGAEATRAIKARWPACRRSRSGRNRPSISATAGRNRGRHSSTRARTSKRTACPAGRMMSTGRRRPTSNRCSRDTSKR